MPLGHSWYKWEDPTRELRMLIRRLETQNSILIGRDVFHYMKAEGSHAATAWSGDNDDIHFNTSRLPSADSQENILFVTGINNHEVAHLIYSPTLQDMRDLWPSNEGPNLMVSRFMDSNYRQLWNVLEDQRIEMLMVKTYANMRPYLMAAFVRVVLIENKDHIDTSYLLARGRRYLPVRVRRLLKKKFKAKNIIPDVRRIIDEFVGLNTFKSAGLYRSHQLVEELLKLLDDNNVLPEGAPQHDGCQQAQTMQQREDASQDYFGLGGSSDTHADEVIADEVEQLTQQIQKQIEEENEGVDSDTESQPQDGDSNSGGDDGGDSATDDATGFQGADPDHDGGPGKNGRQNGAQGAGQDAEDARDADGQGGGAGTGGTPTTQDIQEEAHQAVAAVMAAQNTGDDLKQVATYIRMSHDIDAPRVRTEVPVEDDLKPVARKLEKAMRVKESEVDPYWDTYNNRGRLNIQRLIRNPADRDHAFDRWQEGGLGGVDQEWVVLLDTSGSMTHFMETLSKTAWVMKRAADLVEAKMSVFAYGSHRQHQLAFSPNQRASQAQRPVLPGLGGTEPVSALVEAYRVLAHSQRSVKGLFIMTDGDWSITPSGIPHLGTSETIIQQLNNMGVITHLAHLGYGRRNIDAHKCQTAAAVSKVDELPQVIKDLMTGRMQRVGNDG